MVAGLRYRPARFHRMDIRQRAGGEGYGMSHQFKPGDLALVVACKIPELIGKVVELVEMIPAGGTTKTGDREWENKTNDAAWLVTGPGLLCLTVKGNVEPDTFTSIAERKLMPLRGDFQPERQKSQEVPA